jgi:hypothetical protein
MSLPRAQRIGQARTVQSRPKLGGKDIDRLPFATGRFQKPPGSAGRAPRSLADHSGGLRLEVG